ncbi:MAG: hypothetical protein NVS1B10_08170 [Candidatus Saccharimonadales bacterium]
MKTLRILVGISASAQSPYPNRIIDDSIFDNSAAMNSSQIDAFLNQFPGSCISSNSSFAARDVTGYSPSQGYTYGNNTSAGVIIAHAAQAYNLNPQVLLSTLQKEEGLVRGNGAYGCSPLAISAAVGFGCPDSGGSYNYSGLDLYTIHGSTVSSINGTCVNSSAKIGFSQQIIHAAWLFKFGEMRSEGSINWSIMKTTSVDNSGASWLSNWNNSDDPQSCYGGPMTQGTWQICPNSRANYYDGYTTIDNTPVHIDNGATAALYWYTPHFSSFYDIFTQWFGSTFAALPGTQPSSQSFYSKNVCSIPSFSTASVGRLYHPDTQDFLYTTNSTEACYAIKAGYIWDGVVMQNILSSDSSAEPVYRLASSSSHLFTTSVSVKNTYLTQYGYHDEGIGWYVYSSQVSNSIPVTELTNGTNTFMFTPALSESTYYQDVYKYSSFGTAFFTPSLSSTIGSSNIYRVSKNNQRLYTTDSTERNNALINYGYKDEGVLTNGDIAPNSNNLPVYRLRNSSGDYFYTIDRKERDLAVINYSYLSEGIGFYGLRWSSSTVYRLTNYSNHLRLYTSSGDEGNRAVTIYGFINESNSWYGY